MPPQYDNCVLKIVPESNPLTGVQLGKRDGRLRFTLAPETHAMTREYTVTDPVYLAEPYTGQDIVLLSETPFEEHPCEELTFEFSE